MHTSHAPSSPSLQALSEIASSALSDVQSFSLNAPSPAAMQQQQVPHPQLMYYRVGSQVIVSNTLEIQQKLPKLAGLTGTVVEIPQHPNTWYTLKMDASGALIKLRKSAFDPYFPKPSPPVYQATPLTPTMWISSASPASSSSTPPLSTRYAPPKSEIQKTKSSIPLISLYEEGTQVTICSGKYKDQVGTVLGATNYGHFCVKLNNSGTVIMKKAVDLSEAKVQPMSYVQSAAVEEQLNSSSSSSPESPGSSSDSDPNSLDVNHSLLYKAEAARNCQVEDSTTFIATSSRSKSSDSTGEFLGMKRTRTPSITAILPSHSAKRFCPTNGLTHSW
jgi:hypothetical protein